MEDKDLTEFFDNYVFMNIFSRNKKLYELTNNLDIFLLRTLKDEFSSHYLKKAIKIINQEDDNLGAIDIDRIYSNAVNFMRDYYASKGTPVDVHSLNEGFDFIIGEAEYALVVDIYDELSQFISEIDDLIIYSEKRSKGTISNIIEDELVDFSESTIVSKIMFLEKLGIIDFLRLKQPFSTSINSLANVVSGICGANSTSIQPLLNAMIGKDVNNKNNPLNSVKTVKAVDEKLNKIGYVSK
jgi:hypothetical protein